MAVHSLFQKQKISLEFRIVIKFLEQTINDEIKLIISPLIHLFKKIMMSSKFLRNAQMMERLDERINKSINDKNVWKIKIGIGEKNILRRPRLLNSGEKVTSEIISSDSFFEQNVIIQCTFRGFLYNLFIKISFFIC